MIETVAAPAVITNPWRHWPFEEGRRRCKRLMPRGLALTRQNGFIQFMDMSTERCYDLPPWPADEAAWFEANREKLNSIKLGKRGRIQLDAPTTQATQNTGNEWLIQGATQYAPSSSMFMQSYMGIGQLQTSFNCSFLAWIGLQANLVASGVTESVLMQPMIGYDSVVTGGAGWYWKDEIYSTNVGEIGGTDPAVTYRPGSAAWGVIRYYPSTRTWWTKIYKGTPASGPKYGQPITAGMPMHDRTGHDWGVFTFAYCVVECAMGGNYQCGDVAIRAVFGGLTVKRAAVIYPVNWQTSRSNANFTCDMSATSVNNPTTNPNAQVNLWISPF